MKPRPDDLAATLAERARERRAGADNRTAAARRIEESALFQERARSEGVETHGC